MSGADLGTVFGELADARRWITWREEGRSGRRTKIPYSPVTGRHASTTNPSTWATLEEAQVHAERAGMDGVGIVLGDGLGGIDLDACRDPETGDLSTWAQKIVDGFRTYSEVSPSGTGVKLYAYGAPEELPASRIPMDTVPIRGKDPGVEVYTRARYFCVTGRPLPGAPDEIRECGDLGGAWDRMIRLLRERSGSPATNGESPSSPAGEGLPDDVEGMLAVLDADCAHDDWLRVGMALHHADPEAGLGLWDAWSATAPQRYPGPDEIRRRWASFGTERNRLVTVGSLRHMARERGYRPPRRTREDRDVTLTDTGNASRLVRHHGERIHYAPTWGKWLVESEGFWEIDHRDVRVRELAKDVGRGIRDEALDQIRQVASKKEAAPWKERLTFGLKSLEARRIRDMVDLARGVEGIPLDHEALDADGWLLGLGNGVVNLRTGRFRKADPTDLMTMRSPVPWDEDARTPRWDRALREWFPDPEVRSYVQRVAGAALVGEQRDHVFVIHYGLGGNGKGTFLRALQRVLGPYAVEVHLSLLVETRHKEHDTVKADLFRTRLAVAVETERRVKLAEASVKNLTGGDRIRARRMREDPWSFDPSHSLWLQTNHLPEISGRDEGIWRRIRVVKWENSFRGQEADPNLDETLAGEAPGILRWLVEGCLQWQEHGLDEPEAVVRATLAYREKEDLFSRFQSDACLIFRPDLQMEARELQELLVAWADEEGIDAPTQEIGEWLREHECRKKQIRVTTPDGQQRRPRVWVGVGIEDAGHETEQTDALS